MRDDVRISLVQPRWRGCKGMPRCNRAMGSFRGEGKGIGRARQGTPGRGCARPRAARRARLVFLCAVRHSMPPWRAMSWLRSMSRALAMLDDILKAPSSLPLTTSMWGSSQHHGVRTYEQVRTRTYDQERYVSCYNKRRSWEILHNLWPLVPQRFVVSVVMA